MKVLVQRVSSASVMVADEQVGAIGNGALLFVGVGQEDTDKDALHLAAKTVRLRIFDDGEERMNHAIAAVGGSLLAVSQFTLYGDCRKGNRPSYVKAAPPDKGRKLYECYVKELQNLGCHVETGVFGAQMRVALENDGPVTLMLESTGR